MNCFAVAYQALARPALGGMRNAPALGVGSGVCRTALLFDQRQIERIAQ